MQIKMRMEIGRVLIVEKSEGTFLYNVPDFVLRKVLRLRRFVLLVKATCR